MKKTVTANLGGSVFHIDEDAYQLLDKYLSNLRIHFREEEGSDEIMNDFEMRFAELFSERIRLGYEVISIEQVEEVIRRMGKPEEIFESDMADKEAATPPPPPPVDEPQKKRLMRNPDDKILGGVCSGLAAYLGWDPTFVRLAFALLIPLHGYIVVLYLLLWVILPLAVTATERLQMRGEKITVENIGKTVTDAFDKVGNQVNAAIDKEQTRNTFQRIADVLVQVIGFFLKALAILCGAIMLPILSVILFVLVIMVFSLIIGGTSVLYHLSPFGIDAFASGLSTGTALLGTVCTIFMIGIPVFSLFYMIGCHFFRWKPMSTSTKWVLVAVWAILFFVMTFYIHQNGYLFWNDGGSSWFHNHSSGTGIHYYMP